MASVEGRAETLASVHSTLRETFLASDTADNHQIPRSLARVTLAAVLNNERRSSPDSNVVRTLLDIIRAEETLGNHPTRQNFTGKTTWKSFKERLKLRRTGSNPTCSHNGWMPTTSAPQLQNSLRMADSSGAEALPETDVVMREEDEQRRTSIRLSDALAAEREDRSRMSRELEATEEGSSAGGGEPLRMSLMDLLEETERQFGEEEEEGAAVVSEVSCCVCMVRHKGAAFIPCGHTFCRTCSRELWVHRGHCPLCNSFILEVLDIF